MKKRFGKEMVGSIGKKMVVEREPLLLRRNVNFILVNKVLGF
jgi:hypothetical protein